MFIQRRLSENGSAIGPATLNTLPSDYIDYDDVDESASRSEDGSDEDSAHDVSSAEYFHVSQSLVLGR